MNSNKTSLKSQLIRLGLVVPLALVSVGAYATLNLTIAPAAGSSTGTNDTAPAATTPAATTPAATTPAATTPAATTPAVTTQPPTETKVDAAQYGKEKDQETDFSVDPFTKAEGDESETSGDDLAAQKLLAALELNEKADSALNAYFAAGHAAGRGLLDFNPAGVSDGVLSVQVALGSSSSIFTEPAVVEVAAVAASATGVTPEVTEVAAVAAQKAKLADLTVSTKAIKLGTGVASSLNGSDKLVIGGFGAYGALGFASEYHEAVLRSDAADADRTAEIAAKDGYKASVAAKSSGFGGGVFATYQADETSPLGFSAGAKIRYTQLTHFLTKKEVVKDGSAHEIKKTYYGYKNGAVNADLNVGYALEVAKVAGLPIIVKANAKVVADYDKFEQGLEKDASKGILLLDKRLGLTLSTALLDGKLSPSVTVGLSQANAIQAQSDGFATISVPKNKTDFTKTIGVALQYAFSDTISLAAGFQKVLLPAKAKDAVAKPGDLLDASGGEFGLVYRF
jgi:hypothetical protein